MGLGSCVVNILYQCRHVWEVVTRHAGHKLTRWGIQDNCGSNGKGQSVVDQVMSF